jgi:hypothetical protein
VRFRAGRAHRTTGSMRSHRLGLFEDASWHTFETMALDDLG